MVTKQSFSINTEEDLANYNQNKLALIAQLVKNITNKTLNNISSESLPNELESDYDIFIVETIKNKFNTLLNGGAING